METARKYFVLVGILVARISFAQTPAASQVENRVASVFVAQDFINEQLEKHSKSKMVKNLRIELDPDHEQIFLRGTLHVPVEEIRALNLDPDLGVYKFQVSIRPEANPQGYLILEFPLAQTFFYPASSTNPNRDRVVVPVQMLSLALASVRGYLAALSGDFSGFNRRTKNLKDARKKIEREIRQEKDPEILDSLKTQSESLRLQLAAVPIERKQLQALSKEVEHILGFTGEKELNLNEELGARKNALIFKVKLSQVTPYLKGVTLGGLRIRRDKKDGAGENYLAVDINSDLSGQGVLPAAANSQRTGMKTAPALIVRLNESLFQSSAIVDFEKKKIGGKIRDLAIHLKDDGLHVSGGWHTFFGSIPFDTVVDFVTTGADVFEVRVRDVKLAGLDFEFLTDFVLKSLEKRLDQALIGICQFQYIGEEKDHSRALQVTVNAAALVPAFPDLHLMEVDVRDREFLLKIGRN